MFEAILDFLSLYGLWGLFAAAFISATIFPLASEAVLIAVVAAGVNPYEAMFVATIGNTLGGYTNYFLGKLLKAEKVFKWLGVKQNKVDKVLPYAKKYGVWLAWFGFLPFFGETILIILGMLRSNFLRIALFSLLGKLLRYWIIIFIQMQIMA